MPWPKKKGTAIQNHVKTIQKPSGGPNSLDAIQITPKQPNKRTIKPISLNYKKINHHAQTTKKTNDLTHVPWQNKKELPSQNQPETIQKPTGAPNYLDSSLITPKQPKKRTIKQICAT